MTSGNKKWDSLKAEYLRKVQKTLSSVKHPRSKEVLDDVSSHLDRRFAELGGEQQTRENFQAIITEMGPASDYAELIETGPTAPGRSISRRYLLWLGLAVVVVAGAILLITAMRNDKVGYIVTFEPVKPFAPQTARELLDAFNESHPGDVSTHHFRTGVHGDRLQGHICVDTTAAAKAVVRMIDTSDKLTVVNVRYVTQQELERHLALGQPSLSGAVPTEEPHALPESANRKLLDEQTSEQLKRHEEFSAAWFTVEQRYEAASESEKKEMIQQWVADAAGDDFEKMTRAIAALGNVAATEALGVLMNIAQKPKRGNRPRWMAVRALGRIGEAKAVPLLINLLDHHNSDTRLYAKVALCEITGVYFGDSKQKWTEWAQTRGIEVEQMDVGPKVGSGDQSRRYPTRPASSRNKTVSRTGTWPDGNSSVYGQVYRQAGSSRIGHAKVSLSSAEFGSWVVEVEDHGAFRFENIPSGSYTLRTLETLGYKDTYYNPENKPAEQSTFHLNAGERKSARLAIEPVRPYRKITGRVLDEDGAPFTDCKDLRVYAWVQKQQGDWKGHYRLISSSGVRQDGSYLLDELDGRPVYVQALDWDAPSKDQPYPPRFYPGTFSRNEAKLIAFGDEDVVENVDIPMGRTGGLVLEGQVTAESTGEPVAQALVSIFHYDMFFDLFCAYTDERGRYRIEGLGEGDFIVHVDAVHKGLVKTRKLVAIEPRAQTTPLDFTLRRGAAISGRFVDEQRNPWQVGRSSGTAYAAGRSSGGGASNFVYGNRYAPPYIRNGCTFFYEEGSGDILGVKMIFPTDSTFTLPAILPGRATINFQPRGQGERVLRILYRGEDISETGLVTEPGQKIDDVTIVVAASGGREQPVQAGDMLQFSLYDAFGREVNSQDYKGVPIFLEFGACW